MKKTITLLVCTVMIISCFALLTACGGGNGEDLSDSKYVGTWKASTMALEDESEALSAEWILTLNPDGTGQFVSEEETTDVTWELTDEGFKTKGDTKLKFTDDGDNIKTKILGVDLIFERQE